MRLTDFLRDIGRPVVFYPALNEVVGGLAANILLNQLLYWHDKGSDPQGWIYKTRLEIQHETGLGRDSQESARRELRLRGFLEEKFSTMPRRLLFHLNIDAINKAWEDATTQHKVENQPTEEDAPILHKVENPPSIRVEITHQADTAYGGKSTSKKVENPPAYTESTTEKSTTPPIVPPKGERVHEQRFETFWQNYPKRTAKGAARNIWLRLKPSQALLDTMLTALHAQRDSPQWRKEHGQFIPLASTWLNQSRWEDDVPTIPQTHRSGDMAPDGLTYGVI